MCFSKKSVFHIVWQSYINKQYNLCVSNEIINEYEEIIARKTSPLIASELIRAILLRKNTIFVNPYFHFNLISADPDDNKFVDCAIVANADYIVSQDSHFNILKTIDFPKVNIIRIEDFVKEL
jgi:putative PIN family toxin of toxin-antitoxin system